MAHALPFTKDHPHIRSPQGIMSCEELRYWIRELLEVHHWRPLPLARACGIHTANDRAGGHIRRKLTGGWIYPGEQIRFTRGIRRILAGELVCMHLGGVKWGCVVASHPVPLKLPSRLRYNLTSGRLEYVSTSTETRPSLPSFADVLSKPLRWELE
jgi:hypothetical protein